MNDDVSIFQTHRPGMLALAYRMLGELARAEDMVQEAWIRWQQRTVPVDAPRSFLLTMVTRLCLDELGAARHRREEQRSDRLPEPVDLGQNDLLRVESLDELSMAFLVLLQRLTPAERAVFLLHEVFDMEHAEIARRLDRSEEACRKLLSRAKEHVVAQKRTLETPREEHDRLLRAFVRASTTGDTAALTSLLAEDALFIVDGGPNGQRYGKLRSIGRPVLGAERIVALLLSFSKQEPTQRLMVQERELNGELAVVAFDRGAPQSATFIAAADGRIRQVYLQLNPERLRSISLPA